MTELAESLSRSPASHRALLDSIDGIVLNRPVSQVHRIDARWVVAGVHHNRIWRWWRTEMNQGADPMGREVLPDAVLNDGDSSVGGPCLLTTPGHPRPAFIVAALIDVAPEQRHDVAIHHVPPALSPLGVLD